MKPKIFIGSSAECLPLARVVNENLDHDFDCETWESAFPLSGLTLDSLLSSVDKFDYGILVFGPDDILVLRDIKYLFPRDNVVFESGLFMGRYGRKSVFLIVPRDIPNLHLPSDLLGLTVADYESEKIKRGMNEAATLGAACNKIRREIQTDRRGERLLEFRVRFDRHGGNLPLKVLIDISNTSSSDVLVNELVFIADGVLRRSDKAITRKRLGSKHPRKHQVGEIPV